METFDVTGFFCNPNIHPKKEYDQRLNEMKALAERWGFHLVIGPYNDIVWKNAVRGYEGEPEGGRRCEICYKIRLEMTARKAWDQGFDFFGTTLSISPHKKAEVINRIGRQIEKDTGVKYLEADFKKKDGFKICCRICREEGLYRQDYCGCIYSRRGEQ